MAEITKENTASFNERGLQTRRDRAALRERVQAVSRGRHTTDRAMAALAGELEHGVPSCVGNMSLDALLAFVPWFQSSQRESMADAVGASPHRMAKDLTDRQVWILCMELSGRRVRPEDFSAQRFLSVAPLRVAFLDSGVSANALARRLGWMDRGKADASRVRRALGLAYYSPGHGKPKRRRERCSYDMAERLAVAIGVDLAEVGL